MATAKYNWDEIKQKYFESDVIEVRQFLISFLSVNPKTAGNGTYAKATKGWRDQKESIQKAQTEKAKQDLENDPAVKIQNTNILKAISNYEKTVATLIGLGKISLDQAIKAKPLWEVLRVSQNLPTTYSKADNNNNNVDLGQVISELKNTPDVN